MSRLRKQDIEQEVIKRTSAFSWNVSKGNTKLVNIPSFSLMTKQTCAGSTALCRKHCYCKFITVRPTVAVAWQTNTNIVKNDLSRWESEITPYIKLLNARMFRIHVGGDFYSQRYLDAWIRICKSNTETKFMAFTKSFVLDYSDKPDNMVIIWSLFPDTDVSTVPDGYRAYTVIDGYEYTRQDQDRIDNALRCGENCGKCATCWFIDEKACDVKFALH